jgi:NAD(P)-dependent dehydrogenase (short-subunit alcohol dehydrogenase family)
MRPWVSLRANGLKQTIMSTKDPKEIYRRPPYSDKEQPPPGSEEEMTPKADHGESSYKGTGRLKGRHALITGADSGIGRAVALAFAREGADVAISYLSEETDAQETERLVTEAGCKAVLLPGDIGERRVSEAVARKAIEAFGIIDILVNNAAFQRTYEKFEDISDDEFEETYRVNVFAMFRICKAILPQMKEGGSIINTGSIQSFDPSANLIAYASTKAAIVSFTRSVASYAIKQGVRVNAVAPGPVWTPLIPSTMPKEKLKQFGSQTVFGRAAQPAEIAPIFVFLASDQATYVTGEVYGATGGQMPL